MKSKKLHLLSALCVMTALITYAQDTITKQTFEGITTEWEYIPNPDAYNTAGDIWDTVQYIGDIVPQQGNLLWGIQDLDNPNGGGSFFHVLEFSEINLTGYVNNTFSFWYNVFSFDSGDRLHLDLILNGIVETIEIFNGASGGASTTNWQEHIYNIPDSVTTFAIHIKAKQNGGTDQAGWDNITLTGFPEGSLPLNASFYVDKTTAFCNDTIHFIDNTWGGAEPYNYYWDFNDDDVFDDTIANPLYCYNMPGFYSTTLMVIDQNEDTSALVLTDHIHISYFPSAWINEIHYDDNSKDTDEGVEVVVKDAGDYDLHSFTVSLYNGNNGKKYNDQALDMFTAGDTVENCHFFHHYFSSLQNGAPDGIALDYLGKLISFISYEGSFVATDGPAEGVTSTDIMVSETSSTPEGTSIQYAGVGDNESHFFWQSEISETFGHLNQHQNLNWPENTTWLGNSNAWLENSNWDNGPPGPDTDILLDTGAGDYPILSHSVWINSVTMNDGAYLYDTAGHLHVAETITVKKLLTGGTVTDDPENAIYHYLGSPVKACRAIEAMPPDAYIRKYDEPSQSWENLDGSDTLKPASGYSVFLPSTNNIIIFSDSSVNEEISLHNLSISGSCESYSGFHMLSNPFLSPIDWDLMEKINIAQTVYVWYNGDYIEWNGLVGNLPDGIIPVAQGFFVQVVDEQNSITFPLSSLIPNSSYILKEKNNSALEIAIHYSDMEDNCFLSFRDDATTGFDPQYDALKLQGQDYHPGIYITQNRINYAICYTPVDTSAEYYLGIKAPDDGDYTFMIKGTEFLQTNPLFLKDLITGQIYDLSKNPVIAFFAQQGNDPNRFVLTQNPVGIDETAHSKIQITQKNRQLIIKTPSKEDVTIFSIDGRIVFRKQLPMGFNTIQLERGTYIFHLKNYNKKVVII